MDDAETGREDGAQEGWSLRGARVSSSLELCMTDPNYRPIAADLQGSATKQLSPCTIPSMILTAIPRHNSQGVVQSSGVASRSR